MTILTSILYADGALRLTDHGPRGGGVVLMHVPSGRQISVAPARMLDVAEYLQGFEGRATSPTALFDYLHVFSVDEQVAARRT